MKNIEQKKKNQVGFALLSWIECKYTESHRLWASQLLCGRNVTTKLHSSKPQKLLSNYIQDAISKQKLPTTASNFVYS